MAYLYIFWAAYLTHCAYLVGVGCVNDFQIGSDRQRIVGKVKQGNDSSVFGFVGQSSLGYEFQG